MKQTPPSGRFAPNGSSLILMLDMNKIKTILIIFVSIFIASCSDIQKNAYNDKKEVINDNAIQRGWIPEIIPDSAFQIIEEHNLDTNSINGSFLYVE